MVEVSREPFGEIAARQVDRFTLVLDRRRYRFFRDHLFSDFGFRLDFRLDHLGLIRDDGFGDFGGRFAPGPFQESSRCE